MRLLALFGRPVWLVRFHWFWTFVWFTAIPITVFTEIKYSVAWVALMSAWANFASHFSAAQAARVEKNQDAELESKSN